MKRFKLFVGVLVVMGLFAVSASFAVAADMTGTWNLKVTTANGTGTPVFKIKQTGNRLSGHYSGQFGESSIKGKVRGNEFEIKYSASGVNIVYAGNVDGDKMSGMIDFGGQGTGDFTGAKAAATKK